MRRGIGAIRRLVLLPVTAALLCFAAPASGYVYWSASSNNNAAVAYIGRANLDGSGVNNHFIHIPPAADGTLGGCGMTVTGTDLYWANCNGGTGSTIGRANLNGGGVNNNFITGASNPCDVTVDGPFIYWTGDDPDQLGRANLNGSGVNQNFIPPGNAACGVAVSGSYIYFANYRTNSIGRANLNGTGVKPNFITGVASASGLAVYGSHLYWGSTSSVGRANLDGTGVNDNFITGPSGKVVNVSGVAVDGSYIYWANTGSTTIGRANLNGTGVMYDFIKTSGPLFGIAVDALQQPTVTGLNPKSGPARGGTKVTITGSHLTGVTGVFFGNKKAPFTVESNTEIIATSPPLPAGTTVPVRVITRAGRSPEGKITNYKVRHNGA